MSNTQKTILRFVGVLAIALISHRILNNDSSSPNRSAAPKANTATNSAGRSTSTDTIPKGEIVTVDQVYDGDTLRTEDGRKVRMIGIDAPEEDPTRGPVQCFGVPSATFLRAELPRGTEITLVSDVESTDQYGRTLAYVYRNDDARFMNAHMLRQGLVQAYRVPPNTANAGLFQDLQTEARDGRVGLWGACQPGDLTDRPGGAQPLGN
jgi:micrococcal nuclease